MAGLPGLPRASRCAPSDWSTCLRVVPCAGLLKPDFIFFGEGIPEKALQRSYQEVSLADLFLVIGSSGEVMPACQIPPLAKARGAKADRGQYAMSPISPPMADLFLQGPATEMVGALVKELGV